MHAVTVAVKVHLTPKFFFHLKNRHALVTTSSKKVLDLVKPLNFYVPLKSSSEWTTTA